MPSHEKSNNPKHHLTVDYFERLTHWLGEERVRYLAIVFFIVLAFAIGGGSRSDIISLVILRPIAFVFTFYALLVMQKGDMSSVRVPLMLLGSLAVLMAIQLIPLPPEVWRLLPGRDLYADLYMAAELELPWLPLTISPARTVNSLMSLIVPAAALLLFAVQTRQSRKKLLVVFWVITVVSVLIGILQIVGSERGPLYFYRLSNFGLPVGLFANRNHQALMVAIGILFCVYAMTVGPSGRRWNPALTAICGAALFLFIPFLLVAGSRAGLLIGGLMILASLMVGYLGYFKKLAGGRRAQAKRKAVLIGVSAVSGLLIILLAAFVSMSRSLALDRLLVSSQDELRGEVWPSILSMIRSDWLFGRGFGTFDIAYKQVEKLELLQPAYLNHAHNDWAQWVIEGGVAACCILILFIGWLARRALSFGPVFRKGDNLDILVAFVIVFGCGVASLVDYPLRVPSIMVLMAIACGIISAGTHPSVSRTEH